MLFVWKLDVGGVRFRCRLKQRRRVWVPAASRDASSGKWANCFSRFFVCWIECGCRRVTPFWKCIWAVYVEVYWSCFPGLDEHFMWSKRKRKRWGVKHEHRHTVEQARRPGAEQVMEVNSLSAFVSSSCLCDVVTAVPRRRFICCVSHDIFIRVGLQRVGGDQVFEWVVIPIHWPNLISPTVPSYYTLRPPPHARSHGWRRADEQG